MLDTEPQKDEQGGPSEELGARRPWSAGCAGLLKAPGSARSHRRDRGAAAKLAECSGLQPSSNRARQARGFLSFPSCNMRILTSLGCLGDTAKQAKPHCPRGCEWERGSSSTEPRP